MRIYIIFFLLYFPYLILSQIGGVHTFNFLTLNTSPRIVGLGGYANVIDSDINMGVYNPSLINTSMLSRVGFNYTNYYTDIMYGDFAYCFNFLNYNIVSNIKFIDYGNFIQTDEFSNQLGEFHAGEYLFSIGTSKDINSLFSIGLNTKFAYSSLYLFNSFSVLLDMGVIYVYPEKNLIVNLLVKNFGYQLNTYYGEDRESMPLEISLGVTNQLAHVPIRWHFNLQHVENPQLNFDNTHNQNHISSYILRHIVFGVEFLMHQNFNLFLGYNNRRRFEMMISDRRGMVGFSYGLACTIKRFTFTYSRSLNHFSGGISTFGVTTNLNKID